MLKLSVVIATYNRSDIIIKTLKHLTDQTLDPEYFEVIVMDDGSPDITGRVVKEMISKVPYELKYYVHENHGPGYTQNRGIEKSKGQIVLLLADDIWLSPRALEEHLHFHRNNPQVEIAVLGQIFQSSKLTQSIFLQKWDPFRFSDLEGLSELPYYRFGAANLSFKKEFLLKNGLFLEHRGRAGAAAIEDLELGYRLKKYGLRLHYTTSALGYHYHFTTLDQAIKRWYERGLNYGEFRKYAPDSELTVYFHVLNLKTYNEYANFLRSNENNFCGLERYLFWHIFREIIRRIILNKITTRLFWRPLLDLAEKNRLVATLLNRQIYRAFLYYHFLSGVRDGKKKFGD